MFTKSRVDSRKPFIKSRVDSRKCLSKAELHRSAKVLFDTVVFQRRRKVVFLSFYLFVDLGLCVACS